MTSERLAEVRERAHRVTSHPLDAIDDRRALLAHVDHLTAENARLREGIAALHLPERMYASCIRLTCDNEACQESTRDGERFHADEPTGLVCWECLDEDGEPRDWPCATASLLDPPTEGETDADS